MLMFGVAFVPFFAFCERGRGVGMRRLGAMFFSNDRPAAVDAG